ncbi:cyclic nucleotide-binding domain-containing protein [Nocardioides sp. SOB77]|uniref:Cyclic nucleotide-binding domain-containing protein n=1 Tax=Nocardioides oceani TaxID=3058369 RepID=A0ABT8FLI1_9ACTN|nr:cyclic nucleotide-binding domain-containing protein [Nocardioides oceani]MDN4175376.1 cyclic nucleotide-binding domain-containing protein [Nocardioides oceani]
MSTAPLDLDPQLAAVPLFSGLSGRQRRRLLGKSKVVDHAAGREVAREGEGALALHVILSGTATVTVGGREVRTLGPGDHFGEISLIDGKRRSASVAADGPVRTLAVPHLAFRSLLEDDPTAAQALLVTLCARLREAEA